MSKCEVTGYDFLSATVMLQSLRKRTCTISTRKHRISQYFGCSLIDLVKYNEIGRDCDKAGQDRKKKITKDNDEMLQQQCQENSFNLRNNVAKDLNVSRQCKKSSEIKCGKMQKGLCTF